MVFEETAARSFQDLGGGDRRLAIVKLGEGDLAVGVDEGLLVDATDHLSCCQRRRCPGRRNIRMFALELTMRPFSVLALSSAMTCASVSTKPSWALLASSALSRFFMDPSRGAAHAAHASG